jgi:PAS domain S-box-containing protein
MPLNNTAITPRGIWPGAVALVQRRWGAVSLRAKTLAIIATTTLVLLALISIPLRIFVLDSYQQLEERQVRVDVDRAANALADTLADLSRTGADFAASDEIYAFAADLDPVSIERSLSDATFASHRMSLFLVVDEQGRTLYGRAFDLTGRAQAPLPDELRDQVPVALLPGAEGARSGVVRLPSTLMHVSAHALTGARGGSPPRGALIVGRSLDTAVVREVAATTRLELTLHRLDAAFPAPDVVAARDDLVALPAGVVRPLSDQLIAGYRMLSDIDGRPVAVLRVQASRPVHAQGQVSVVYFTLGLLLATCVSGGGTLALLQRSVIARQTRLSAEVRRIGASGDLSARVAVAGGDEIARLSAAINAMLGSLEQAQIERNQAELETQRAAETLRDAYAQLTVLTDQLRRSRDTLRTLFDGVDEGMALVDGDGRVLAANQRLATLLGCGPEALVGSRIDAMDTAEPAAAVPIAAAIQGSLDDGRARQERVILDDDAGRHRAFDLQVLPLLDDTAAVEQAIVHVTDVTERLRLEAAAIQSERFAAGARLAAAVAHELNTPLQSIQSCLDLARIEEQREVYLTIAQEEIRRISTVLRSLLAVHRPGDGEPKPLDLNALVDRLLLLTGSTLGDRSVYVERELAEGLPQVQGRPDQITQVLLNLVMNAADAMVEGGTITIRTRAADDEPGGPDEPARRPETGGDASEPSFVLIEVADTGPGVPPELRARIFDPFFTTKTEGSGLGLAICRQIVADHGGRIDVDGELGRGAVFRIMLPAAERLEETREVRG